MNMIKIIPSQLITIKSDETKTRKNQPDYKLGGGKSSTVISILEHINVFETQSNPPPNLKTFPSHPISIFPGLLIGLFHKLNILYYCGSLNSCQMMLNLLKAEKVH